MRKNSFASGNFILAAALVSAVFFGCSESRQPGERQPEPVSENSTLVNYHPILDRNVRPGDSMLVDFDALIKEDIIVEADMARIGSWVLQRGGLAKPDSSVLGITYRELLRNVLVRDMSGGAEPCIGCTDSILISTLGYSTQIYLGMGRTSLQKMLRSALDNVGEVSGEYAEGAMNNKIDLETWQEEIENLPRKVEGLDLVLFGNALVLLNRERNNLGEYTFGQLLAAVDTVKEMDGYQDVRRLFERTIPQENQP